MTRSLASLSALSAALIAAPAVRVTSQVPDAAVRLAIGTPIDREISGRERHLYALPLSAGDYVDVVVVQRGIDVVVDVSDSAGTLIAGFDADERKQGMETV